MDDTFENAVKTNTVHVPRTLNQCIAALEAKNQQLRDICDRLAADCDTWEKRVNRTEAEVERLREALEEIVKLSTSKSFPHRGCTYCGIGLEHRSWCPVTLARPALEPAP